MKTPAYRFRGRVHRIVDGDTYELTLDLGFKTAITVTVRLRGVDCPEMDTAAGQAAKRWVQSALTLGGDWPLVVETSKDRAGRDEQTFARWVADVWLPAGQLGDLLVVAGHARPIDR